MSPDLNPIENIWRLMARDIYAGGKQFSNVYELKTAIQKSWDNIDKEIIKKLVNSKLTVYLKLYLQKVNKLNIRYENLLFFEQSC